MSRTEKQKAQAREGNRRWKERHPEQAKASADATAKRWRLAHPGRSAWQKAHPEKGVEMEQRRRWRKMVRRLIVIQTLGGKCVDCGNDDPRVLDFDHTDRAEKKRNLSGHTFRKALDEIVAEEVAKCVLRCANCHRVKTWTRFEYNGSR